MNEGPINVVGELGRWSVLSLDGRLSLLSAYAAYWFGSPQNEATGAVLNLPTFLPPAVQWLYRAVASRNSEPFAAGFGDWTDGSPVIIYHWLKHPAALDIDEQGFIEFLNETQCAYQCGIRPNFADPEVFGREGRGGWLKQANRLSDFILLTIVSELTVNCPTTASGQFHSAQFNALVLGLLRVAIDSVVWMGSPSVSLHQGDGFVVLGVENSDGTITAFAGAKREMASLLRMKADWEFFDAES